MADDLYSDVGKRLDTVLGVKRADIDFWRAVKKAREEFHQTRDSDQYDGFMEHMRDAYGIQLFFAPDGNIRPKFEILDEQKYLIFKLKYE